jgi:hypothetical protein
MLTINMVTTVEFSMVFGSFKHAVSSGYQTPLPYWEVYTALMFRILVVWYVMLCSG